MGAGSCGLVVQVHPENDPCSHQGRGHVDRTAWARVATSTATGGGNEAPPGDVRGAFARVAVTSLACPRGPGYTWPVSSGAIHHVCFPVLCGSGQNEFVFVQHHPAGPKLQSTG
jgi:hypothetical protein